MIRSMIASQIVASQSFPMRLYQPFGSNCVQKITEPFTLRASMISRSSRVCSVDTGLDKEWDKRKSTKLQKLIRSAEFRYPNACMEDIEYHPDRNLDKGQMLEFSTCRYISDDHHIILKGASGNGKTYIACALGIAACRNFIKVRYVRLPDLLNELAVAHGDGTLKKVIKAYQKIDLLILDEFLLTSIPNRSSKDNP